VDEATAELIDKEVDTLPTPSLIHPILENGWSKAPYITANVGLFKGSS
jgi:hypothetical protein